MGSRPCRRTATAAYCAAKRGALAITSPRSSSTECSRCIRRSRNLPERYRAQGADRFHAVGVAVSRALALRRAGSARERHGAAQGRTRWLVESRVAVLPAGEARATRSDRARARAERAAGAARRCRRELVGASRLPEADADTLQRIADLYSTDEYSRARLQSALAADGIAGERAAAHGRPRSAQRAERRRSSGRQVSRSADGPRIAVLEAGGWDTHANQGAERRAARAIDCAVSIRRLDTLRTSLGAAWHEDAVLVVTEFGRTVAVNGTGGTDHGTATCAFLTGGAVAGGRVIADWPGLATSALYEGRDLRPTLDLRSVIKGVLASHLGAAESGLEEQVFPGSRAARPLEGCLGESPEPSALARAAAAAQPGAASGSGTCAGPRARPAYGCRGRAGRGRRSPSPHDPRRTRCPLRRRGADRLRSPGRSRDRD